MKLSDYVKHLGMEYRTVWNWYKASKIPNAFKTPGGSIVVMDAESIRDDCVVTSARVSSSENKDDLNTRTDRLLLRVG